MCCPHPTRLIEKDRFFGHSIYPLSFHCHCLKIKYSGSYGEERNSPHQPGLNRVKLLRAHESTCKMLIDLNILYSGGNVYSVTATHLSPELSACFASRASYRERRWLWGDKARFLEVIYAPSKKNIIQKLN